MVFGDHDLLAQGSAWVFLWSQGPIFISFALDFDADAVGG
jgi:hypothetical protein